tara:strand:+ start:1888 stop:2475 length:588 start_codon:yes stop_codon:yes gene_type:complete
MIDLTKQPTKRLATPDEVKALFTYIVNDFWEGSLLYANSIGKDDINMGYANFLKKEMQDLKNTIGDFVIVDHFEELDVLLYSYLYSSFNPDTNDHIIHNNMVLRIGNNFQDIKEWQIFNLHDVIIKSFKPKIVTAGRPKKPSEKSIIKTHKIRLLILEDGMLVDDACKKVELAKSTYYRVSKWIVKNSAFKSFPK